MAYSEESLKQLYSALPKMVDHSKTTRNSTMVLWEYFYKT